MTMLDDWGRYIEWLYRNATRAHANLNGPANELEIASLEQAIGQTLPVSLRTLLATNDGERNSKTSAVMPGLHFLSSRDIAKEWSVWARFRKSETADGLESLDASCRALDAGVRDVYTHPAWIPVFKDGDRSDYLGLDLAPTDSGATGQIINFGRDEENHFIAFPNLEGCIAYFLGEVELGHTESVTRGAVDCLLHKGGNTLDVLRDRHG